MATPLPKIVLPRRLGSRLWFSPNLILASAHWWKLSSLIHLGVTLRPSDVASGQASACSGECRAVWCWAMKMPPRST